MKKINSIAYFMLGIISFICFLYEIFEENIFKSAVFGFLALTFVVLSLVYNIATDGLLTYYYYIISCLFFILAISSIQSITKSTEVNFKLIIIYIVQSLIFLVNGLYLGKFKQYNKMQS